MTILPVFVSCSLLLASLGWPVPHQPVSAASKQAAAKAGKLLVAGKYQQAADAYTEAARLDPRNSEAYLGRARAHAALHQPERVEEDYEFAIRAAPDSVEPLTTRAMDRVFAGRYTEAIPDLDAALRINPDDEDLYHWRGMCRINSGQSALSLSDYNRAIQLAPKDSPSLVNYYVNRSIAQFNLGHYEEALADHIHAEESGFDYAPGRAECLMQLHRFQEALAVYNELLPPLQPGSEPAENRWELLRARALVRAKLKDFKGAETDMIDAVALKPNEAHVYGTLAWIQVMAKHPAEAQITALQGLALDGSQEWIRINLADAYLLAGKFDEAKKIYLEDANKWTSPGKTGLQSVKEDFADLREAGINLPEMASIEAMLPQTSQPPPTPTPSPSPTPAPQPPKFFPYSPGATAAPSPSPGTF